MLVRSDTALLAEVNCPRRWAARLAELACGDFDVLFGKRVGDVESGKAAGCEAAGIEPEAHGILALAKDDDGADAGYAL